MSWTDVAAGLSGGLRGGLDALSYRDELALKDRQISSREEIARLQSEIRMLIAQANNATRETVAGVNAGSRENVAGITAGSRVDVANVGADARRDVATIGATSREHVAGENNRTRFNIVTTQQAGADRRLGRTQAFRQSLEEFLETGRNTRAGNANALREREGEANRAVDRERLRRRSDPFAGLFETDPIGAQTELIEGTGRPTAEPIEVREPPSDDRPLPRSPEADADKLEQAASKVKGLMEQIKTAATPAARNALRRQLRLALEEYQKAGGQ